MFFIEKKGSGVMKSEKRLEFLERQWQERFKELCEFKEQHGHCNVPITYEENPRLSIWVMNQRSNYKKNGIDKERIKQLEGIGFNWVQRERKSRVIYSWDKMFNALLKFREEYHHVIVPSSYANEQGMRLGVWASTQRSFYSRGMLEERKIKQLNRIGFVWDINEWAWEQRYEELVLFKERYGHCNVPIEEQGRVYEHCTLFKKPFGEWVELQKKDYLKGKLNTYQVEKLNELGLDLTYTKRDLAWDKMFEALVEYGEEYGTVNFSLLEKYHPYHKLSIWTNNQRTRYNQGKMLQKRVEKLESIGFVWSLSTSEEVVNPSWKRKYDELKEYMESVDNGAMSLKNHDFLLHKWVVKQASRHKEGELTALQVSMFQEIGICLDTYVKDSGIWARSYKKLEVALEEADKQGLELSMADYASYLWLKRQRAMLLDGELADWKRELIERIPLKAAETKKVNSSWLASYSKVLRAVNDGLTIREITLKNREAYTWVKTQERKLRNNKLSNHQKSLLAEIGIV